MKSRSKQIEIEDYIEPKKSQLQISKCKKYWTHQGIISLKQVSSTQSNIKFLPKEPFKDKDELLIWLYEEITLKYIGQRFCKNTLLLIEKEITKRITLLIFHNLYPLNVPLYKPHVYFDFESGTIQIDYHQQEKIYINKTVLLDAE